MNKVNKNDDDREDNNCDAMVKSVTRFFFNPLYREKLKERYTTTYFFLLLPSFPDRVRKEEGSSSSFGKSLVGEKGGKSRPPSRSEAAVFPCSASGTAEPINRTPRSRETTFGGSLAPH